ncbi:tRNA lysidine(34) synthetase TilS [Microcoleus sp. FACHB-831]|uniref:tRNA lysidine(34) synthetase TilS n=1 Tax=Microcoleus sp. FACHB-831 TaxID=2692827 RepID=UPI001683C9AD|nr:tRNA lysidine(34) synthetase TilS [Microcoleus sp. FACHB-831]MBD1924120.1 tRNA lysidine(34) synthetase TilS [Microcoleus sp. FACHB-831]
MTNWTPIHAKLQRSLKQRHLFERNQRLLVALSGGQDSLCLGKLLLDLQPKWGWQLAIAHCDHRWEYDTGIAAHVEGVVQSWQLPFYLKTAIEVTQSEGAARQWRYKALSEIATEHGYECVVTAHTQSDRAETLLFNLMRGSGADGLQSLSWRRHLAEGIQLVRPLLEVSRAETLQFCQELQLPIWEDVYNQDLKYSRNRIRLELLPQLRTHFNPQVEQALAQTAELLRADVEYLEEQASLLRQEIMTDNQGLGLNRRVLGDAPLALQRRVVRQFLQQLLASAPSFEQIEKVTALITAPNKSRTDPFPGGAIAEVNGEWIILNYEF